MALVALRDRHDEPQVGVDHLLLGGGVAALDALGELDLLLRGEQRIAADLVQEELQAVGRRVASPPFEYSPSPASAADAVVGDLDPAALELLVQLLHRLVFELVRREQRLDLREREAAVALALLEKGEDLVGEIDRRSTVSVIA